MCRALVWASSKAKTQLWQLGLESSDGFTENRIEIMQVIYQHSSQMIEQSYCPHSPFLWFHWGESFCLQLQYFYNSIFSALRAMNCPLHQEWNRLHVFLKDLLRCKSIYLEQLNLCYLDVSLSAECFCNFQKLESALMWTHNIMCKLS